MSLTNPTLSLNLNSPHKISKSTTKVATYLDKSYAFSNFFFFLNPKLASLRIQILEKYINTLKKIKNKKGDWKRRRYPDLRHRIEETQTIHVIQPHLTFFLSHSTSTLSANSQHRHQNPTSEKQLFFTACNIKTENSDHPNSPTYRNPERK